MRFANELASVARSTFAVLFALAAPLAWIVPLALIELPAKAMPAVEMSDPGPPVSNRSVGPNPEQRADEFDAFVPAALYPVDRRRAMTAADYRRFPGAGVLFCRSEDNIPQKAAASWLIGDRSLVLMNAHNFRDHRAEITRGIEGCYFQIGGRNYLFDAGSLELGIPANAKALHITDDWALVRLAKPVESGVEPQPVPQAPDFTAGYETIKVTMVSPAGHANLRTVGTSIENCAIKEIDPPSEDGIRRARHDCNDGFGGSGSGIFDEAGHLVAMQSASLDMNRRMPFDLEDHYGSALLIEGKLLEAIRREIGAAR